MPRGWQPSQPNQPSQTNASVQQPSQTYTGYQQAEGGQEGGAEDDNEEDDGEDENDPHEQAYQEGQSNVYLQAYVTEWLGTEEVHSNFTPEKPSPGVTVLIAIPRTFIHTREHRQRVQQIYGRLFQVRLRLISLTVLAIRSLRRPRGICKRNRHRAHIINRRLLPRTISKRVSQGEKVLISKEPTLGRRRRTMRRSTRLFMCETRTSSLRGEFLLSS
jgi:hypothetical protein